MALRCRAFAALLVCLVFAGPTLSAIACPFCQSGGQTLTQDASQAMLIVFGALTNPNVVQGTTDLEIETVIKSHEFLGKKKTLTLNRFIPVEKDKPVKYLVFCDVFKDKLDAYRGVALKPGSKIAEYLKGALEVRDKDVNTRLAYFFKYLDSEEYDLANDAFGEFANADYKDYRSLAEKLPASQLVKWLKDESTPVSRFGLYGSMLGHCGKAKDAATLREMLDDPNKRFSTGIDGLLAGYVMLDPKEGWKYVREVLKDSSKDFLLRYAALRTARFFWDYRTDVIVKNDIVSAVSALMEQNDIADLAIEDLRKWHRWEMLDKVLGFFGEKSHDVPIIKRSILRFALNCPGKDFPRAAEFVKAQQKRDGEWVKDVEELLQLELDVKPKVDTSAGPASAAPSAKSQK
jgi:hypothetical protein